MGDVRSGSDADPADSRTPTAQEQQVAALTGLSARQLQWWDERRLFLPAVAPKPTAAGGFTERRYTPVDLLELMVLADLRRQGLTVARLRLLLETLRTRFGFDCSTRSAARDR